MASAGAVWSSAPGERAGAAARRAGFRERVSGVLPELTQGLRLNRSFPSLVLNRRDLRLPEKVRRRGRNSTEAVQSLLPKADLSARYNRCAVVGNSGILLHQHVGLVINGYDAVLRFNNAPTRGFAQYVGTKTTFRAINNRWTKALAKALEKQGRRAALQLLPADSRQTSSLLCFGDGATGMYLSIRRHLLPQDRMVYHIAHEVTAHAKDVFREFQQRMERVGFGPFRGGRTMPSGFEGLVLMMQICNELDVYGFDPQTDGDVKYHYFDDVKPDGTPHSFEFSFDFLRVLHEAQIVRLCTPRHSNNTGCPKERKTENELGLTWRD